jgi:thiol:disulfide interchange protein DsbD
MKHARGWVFVFLALAGLSAVVGLAGSAVAKPWWIRGVESNESDFLPPDAAFRAGCNLDGNEVKVRWVIADGYYLYRRQMQIVAESPGLTLGDPSFPPGRMKDDPYLGTQEIFVHQVEATVPYTRQDAGAHPVQIKVTYQGCAEAGLCYPPITKVLFADRVAQAPRAAARAWVAHPWEAFAIGGGGLAFVLAGFLLRRGRQLALPAS